MFYLPICTTKSRGTGVIGQHRRWVPMVLCAIGQDPHITVCPGSNSIHVYCRNDVYLVIASMSEYPNQAGGAAAPQTAASTSDAKELPAGDEVKATKRSMRSSRSVAASLGDSNSQSMDLSGMKDLLMFKTEKFCTICAFRSVERSFISVESIHSSLNVGTLLFNYNNSTGYELEIEI